MMEPQHTSTVLTEIISMNDSMSDGLDAVAQGLGHPDHQTSLHLIFIYGAI
jgi:hypothetical protein